MVLVIWITIFFVIPWKSQWIRCALALLKQKQAIMFACALVIEGGIRGVLVKKGVPENLANFTGKHLYWSLFLIKLWLSAFKKETLAHVFSCKFCEFSKNTFLQNTSGRLVLTLPNFHRIKLHDTIHQIRYLKIYM